MKYINISKNIETFSSIKLILYYLCYKQLCFLSQNNKKTMAKIISRDSVIRANDNIQRRSSSNVNTSSSSVSARIATSFGTKTVTISKSEVQRSANSVMEKYLRK